MPTYEYECGTCGYRFELQQAMTASQITECPKCHGSVRRVVTGGAGFILKNSPNHAAQTPKGCAYESTGVTCCGRGERCGHASCDGDE
jgi:putative FmdB family regulatory protein